MVLKIFRSVFDLINKNRAARLRVEWSMSDICQDMLGNSLSGSPCFPIGWQLFLADYSSSPIQWKHLANVPSGCTKLFGNLIISQCVLKSTVPTMRYHKVSFPACVGRHWFLYIFVEETCLCLITSTTKDTTTKINIIIGSSTNYMWGAV
jgi:hypothetical protein